MTKTKQRKEVPPLKKRKEVPPWEEPVKKRKVYHGFEHAEEAFDDIYFGDYDSVIVLPD